ncbi:MAG: InlB B-repeat-containing protein [Spirochaetes bacterium]|nr:InlB B-repeat-containing protein [Spirochaetota bacterium]
MKKSTMLRKMVLSMALVAILMSCEMAGITGKSGDLSNLAGTFATEKSLASSNANSFLLNFDPSGGTVDSASKAVKVGQAYGELPVPTKVGFAFGGWHTEPDGRGNLVTDSSKVVANAGHTLYASWNFAPQKIYATAAILPDCFFFEFDADNVGKVAKVLLPLSENGYLQDGRVQYREVKYRLTSFIFDPSSGAMAGSTDSNEGVSYSFAGEYSPIVGFFGTIDKLDHGIKTSGSMGGTPVFPGMRVANYVGAATYQFDSSNSLLFSATINKDTNGVVGTWCESALGGTYSFHGTITGVADQDSIHISALPLPLFEPFIPGMTATGEGSYLDSGKKDISGTFTILFGGDELPSLLNATLER